MLLFGFVLTATREVAATSPAVRTVTELRLTGRAQAVRSGAKAGTRVNGTRHPVSRQVGRSRDVDSRGASAEVLSCHLGPCGSTPSSVKQGH